MQAVQELGGAKDKTLLLPKAAFQEKKKTPLKDNVWCMVGNGLPQDCLVWGFFFTRADFLAKIRDENNERKEGAGENLVASQISMCECKSISLLKEEPNQNMLH